MLSDVGASHSESSVRCHASQTGTSTSTSANQASPIPSAVFAETLLLMAPTSTSHGSPARRSQGSNPAPPLPLPLYISNASNLSRPGCMYTYTWISSPAPKSDCSHISGNLVILLSGFSLSVAHWFMYHRSFPLCFTGSLYHVHLDIWATFINCLLINLPHSFRTTSIPPLSAWDDQRDLLQSSNIHQSSCPHSTSRIALSFACCVALISCFISASPSYFSFHCISHHLSSPTQSSTSTNPIPSISAPSKMPLVSSGYRILL